MSENSKMLGKAAFDALSNLPKMPTSKIDLKQPENLVIKKSWIEKHPFLYGLIMLILGAVISRLAEILIQ